MGLEVYAYESLTGRRLVPLPVSDSSWKITTNADDTITCRVPARAAVVKQLDIWGSTPLAYTGLLAVVDGTPVAFGPLWKRRYTQGKDIDLTASGFRSLLNRALCLPVAARTGSLVDVVTGDPDPAFDTVLAGLSYGTIIKRWLEQWQTWPGADIPLILPADELGTREKTVLGIDLKKIGALIDAMTGLEAGPDVAFRPVWSADGLGIDVLVTTGTNANRRLGNTDASLVTWHVGAPVGGAFDLVVDEDGTGLAEEVFAAGGRSSDKVLVSHARDTTLHDAGFPLLQAADTSHSDVTEQATLDNYAAGGVAMGKHPASFWKMKVRAHEEGTPPLGDYWLGDMATIVVDPREPVLPAGAYPRRIASIGGNAMNDSYDLAFAEAIA